MQNDSAKANRRGRGAKASGKNAASTSAKSQAKTPRAQTAPARQQASQKPSRTAASQNSGASQPSAGGSPGKAKVPPPAPSDKTKREVTDSLEQMEALRRNSGENQPGLTTLRTDNMFRLLNQAAQTQRLRPAAWKWLAGVSSSKLRCESLLKGEESETCWLWIVVVTFHHNPTLPLRGHDGRPVVFKFNANGLNTEWAPGHTIFGWYVEPALRDALATLTPDRWTLMLKDQWAMFVGYSVNVRKGGRGKAFTRTTEPGRTRCRCGV